MIVIETFKEMIGHNEAQLKGDSPTCFNGYVRVEKYRITIEKIKESKEVYQTRLQKMWEECDNNHHWNPLKIKAKKLGVELEGSAGSKRKKRS